MPKPANGAAVGWSGGTWCRAGEVPASSRLAVSDVTNNVRVQELGKNKGDYAALALRISLAVIGPRRN